MATTVKSIRNYECHTLALKTFLDQPGDRRIQPVIPAADLSWSLLLGGILRMVSANRLEWLANCADLNDLGLTCSFGDDALSYFTERVDPEVIRRRAAQTLKLAKANKVFEGTAFIGLALDGTTAGHTTKKPCPFCHPIKDSKDKVIGYNHQMMMISVVGVGISLPFDVELYKPGDSEYAAGKRLLKRAVNLIGPRFADYWRKNLKAHWRSRRQIFNRAFSPHLRPGRASYHCQAEAEPPGTGRSGRSALQPDATNDYVSTWRRLD